MAILVKACVVLVVIAIIFLAFEILFSRPSDEIEDWSSDSKKDKDDEGIKQ